MPAPLTTRNNSYTPRACQSPPEKKVERFWNRYIQYLHKQGVKPPADRWYVVRAEEYIKASGGKRLAGQQPSDASEYLQQLGERNDLSNWQFRQAVDAIQKLLCEIVHVPWCKEVDWAYWKASA